MPNDKPRSNDDAAMRIARAVAAGKQRFTEENPGAVFTLSKAADVIRAQLALEYPKPAKGGRVNGRDLIFDALALACRIDGSCITRAMARQIATAKRDILEASPSATPEDIAQRADAYRRKYRDAACTPMALANHWAEFGNGSEKRTLGARMDIYQEPPNGWRERIKAHGLPNMSAETTAVICGKPWEDIRMSFGRQIKGLLEEMDRQGQP